MAGRAGKPTADGKWEKIVYLPCTKENNFIPELPATRPDVIYLCYPNNPTGTTLKKNELKQWVDYARANDVLILFDAAYEAFISEPDVPHSIYEIEGAREVAVEFRSFSKTAGFTGLRCGYTVVPKTVLVNSVEHGRVPLNRLWNRRQTTKFNGTAYIVQRAAEAVYSDEGQQQIKETIGIYMKRFKYLVILLCSVGAIVLNSCLSNSVTNYSDDARVYSFAIKNDSVPAFAKQTFTVSQTGGSPYHTNGLIYNTDSLPFKTKLYGHFRAIPIIRTYSSAAIFFNKKSYKSGDSIDFRSTQILKNYAENAIDTMSYYVDVRVHKVEPDSIACSKEERAFTQDTPTPWRPPDTL